MCIQCVLIDLGVDLNHFFLVVSAHLAKGLRESDERRGKRPSGPSEILPVLKLAGDHWNDLDEDGYVVLFGLDRRPLKFPEELADGYIDHIVEETVKRYENPSYSVSYLTPRQFRDATEGTGVTA